MLKNTKTKSKKAKQSNSKQPNSIKQLLIILVVCLIGSVCVDKLVKFFFFNCNRLDIFFIIILVVAHMY